MNVYSHIFEHISNDHEGTEYVIKCSFLEIYKEIIRDLLNPKNALSALYENVVV